MTIPTIGVCRDVIVAHITKFLFRLVTTHTLVLKAHVDRPAFRIDIDPHVVTHHVVTPLPQELHVLPAHKIPRLYTLGILLGDLWFGLWSSFSKICPERNRHQGYEDYQSGDDLSGIIHFLLPPDSKVVDAYQGCVVVLQIPRAERPEHWPQARAHHTPGHLGPSSS